MSVTPVNAENPYNPYDPWANVSKSRLLQAANREGRTATSYDPSQMTIREAVQILRRITPTGPLTYEALMGMSAEDLPAQFRGLILYLQRYPGIFSQVSSLGGLQTMATTNPANVLAKQRLADLQQQEQRSEVNRNETNRNASAAVLPSALSAFSSNSPQQDLISLFQALARNLEQRQQTDPTTRQANNNQERQAGFQIPFNQLSRLATQPDQVNRLTLTDRQREQLNTLLQPTVLNLLQGLARAQQNMLNPDVIRILVSLLWNPTLHRPGGIIPLAAFEEPEVPEEEENIEAVESSVEDQAVATGVERQMQEPHDPTESAFQRIELSTHEIRDLCRHMKLSGGITLEEFQNYQPLNEREEELLRYLRQFNIFHAIADLNGKDETLDPADIRIALHDGSLVLSDEHITLVFTP